MTQQYNNPANSQPSTAGTQLQDFYYARKALTEIAHEQFFTPLASTTDMPMHYGKRIVRYVYVPLLDDRNVNDEGIDAQGVTIANGNLYGSSRDVGKIVGKMPVLSETGGRVNRVGYTRKTIEGTFQNYGIFSDYTEDSVNFDTDSELMTHINREMLIGANQVTEDLLQVDLISNAGVNIYAGAATTTATISKTDVVDYATLVNLATTLDNNRCPKDTKINTCSTMVDTKTLPAARILYAGPAMKNTFRKMTDFFGNPAFIPTHQYASGQTPLKGEIGQIDEFRIVINPQMMAWEGTGAAGTNADGVHTSGGKVNVYPLLVVGSESFTTIGFQSDAKSVKFKIIHKKPGIETASDRDPYGKKGFMSVQWWYGFMVLRAERLAVIKTAAKL